MLSGLVSIALGVVLAIRPDIGALTLATVFGLFSIVYGVATITIGAQVRRAGRPQQPTAGQLDPRRSLTHAAADRAVAGFPRSESGPAAAATTGPTARASHWGRQMTTTTDRPARIG